MSSDRPGVAREARSFRHVQIVSVGHSGSSLLNLLLGAHPAVLSVGEVWSLYEVWNSERCACRAELDACPFWTRVLKRLAEADGCPPGRLSQEHPLRDGVLRRRRGSMILWPSDLLLAFGSQGGVHLGANVLPTMARSLEAARSNLRLLESVARTGGRRIVVDSSKNPLRARLLHLADPASFRMIHMVRDGRGVARSWMKAYGTRTYRGAALQWVLRDRLIHLMTREIPDHDKYQLRYEDLCAEPEATLRELCAFLGTDFDARMLDFQAVERHDVHINPRPLESANQEIRLDEKWRRTVSPEDLRAFERIGGAWNRRYGYGD